MRYDDWGKLLFILVNINNWVYFVAFKMSEHGLNFPKLNILWCDMCPELCYMKYLYLIIIWLLSDFSIKFVNSSVNKCSPFFKLLYRILLVKKNYFNKHLHQQTQISFYKKAKTKVKCNTFYKRIIQTKRKKISFMREHITIKTRK